MLNFSATLLNRDDYQNPRNLGVECEDREILKRMQLDIISKMVTVKTTETVKILEKTKGIRKLTFKN